MADTLMVPVLNTDNEDFHFTYDSTEYVIYAGEIGRFPKHLAEHAKKHLAKKLVFKRGWQGSNYEDEYNKTIKEISLDE